MRLLALVPALVLAACTTGATTAGPDGDQRPGVSTTGTATSPPTTTWTTGTGTTGTVTSPTWTSTYTWTGPGTGTATWTTSPSTWVTTTTWGTGTATWSSTSTWSTTSTWGTTPEPEPCIENATPPVDTFDLAAYDLCNTTTAYPVDVFRADCQGTEYDIARVPSANGNAAYYYDAVTGELVSVYECAASAIYCEGTSTCAWSGTPISNNCTRLSTHTCNVGTGTGTGTGTGSPGTGTGTGGPEDTGTEGGDKGCATGSGPVGSWWMLAGLLLLRRGERRAK